jgi:beta-aspartyl-peptidase (threonine type)
MAKLALAVHGGAGTIRRSQITAELERVYREALRNALAIGWQVLEMKGSSLEAVEAAVCSLEDFPLFNAGRGSVFTHEGRQEMDASLMEGRTLKAGAVAFVRNIKNPIRLARLVMEKTEHILLAGDGANRFAEQMGVETMPDKYFFTDERWAQFQDALSRGEVQLDHAGTQPSPETAVNATPKPIGTVGAVACDHAGNVSSATSTGGMTNKRFGRVGDTPLIGSGTYADDLCAVSCTGHGEYFMLTAAAYDVAARMRYSGLSLSEAARQTVDRLTQIGGEGGLIAVDSAGNVSMPFNSEGMYRGRVDASGELVTGIYNENI